MGLGAEAGPKHEDGRVRVACGPGVTVTMDMYEAPPNKEFNW